MAVSFFLCKFAQKAETYGTTTSMARQLLAAVGAALS